MPSTLTLGFAEDIISARSKERNMEKSSRPVRTPINLCDSTHERLNSYHPHFQEAHVFNHRFSMFLAAYFVALSAFLVSQPQALGVSKEQILHRFQKNNQDGLDPSFQAGLTFDAAGNLYGTTESGGGPNGCGTVFRLTPANKGQWKEKVLYGFQCGTDGDRPMAGVVFDAAGNLYGTTVLGGDGYGTVFELIRGANDTWSEKTLYSFANGTDGGNPISPVIFDASANLYGTVSAGVNAGCDGNGCGGVFVLKPGSNGTWTETVICSFLGGTNGSNPQGGLIFDAAGNLYGTTVSGGDLRYCRGNGCGLAFELKPRSGGQWREKVLHAFNAKDGDGPLAGMIFDSVGNLYGTTNGGGPRPGCGFGTCGTVFKLTRGEKGTWSQTTINTFKNSTTQGARPFAGVIFDSAGNLYGTTADGGANHCGFSGCGTVYKLIPGAHGKWTETVLHSFNGSDGPIPSNVVMDSAGNLYGTTFQGGGGYGTVFKILR
jgi:uncharacterized repeat protein (TIGR03803 family)